MILNFAKFYRMEGAKECWSPMVKKCRFCGKSFPTDMALKRHLRENHRGYYYGIKLAPVITVIVIVLAIIFIATFPGGTMPTTISTGPHVATPPTTQIHTTQDQTKQRRPAPDFELPEIDELGLTGKTVRLSQFEGKPVFLEFMSPTCPHCLRMAPIIKGLEEKYGDRIVFISVVYPAGGIEHASKVLAEEGLNWIHVVDERARVFDAYDVSGTPTYIVLDKDHVEVKRIVGENSKEVLEEAILSVIS
jgi:thiol-disulfide isomerase/thioredoxin